MPSRPIQMSRPHGTTLCNSLVYEECIASFRRETWADPATRAAVAAVTASGMSDADALRAAVQHFAALIDGDVKDPVLKDLQGRIWELGYASGELVGEARRAEAVTARAAFPCPPALPPVCDSSLFYTGRYSPAQTI